MCTRTSAIPRQIRTRCLRGNVAGHRGAGPALAAVALAALAACGPPQSVSVVDPDVVGRDGARPPDTGAHDGGPLDAAPHDAAAPPSASDAASPDLLPADASHGESTPPTDAAAVDTGPPGPPDVGGAADRPGEAAPASDGPPADVAGADLLPDTLAERPGPWVMGAYAPATQLTDLTAAGPVDWVHFGHQGPGRRNRKAGVAPRLQMSVVGEAEIYSYSDRPVRFAWRDGTPDGQVSTTADGISVGEAVGRGFEVRVQNPSSRPATLRLYVGAWNARGRLTVRLGEAGPILYTDATLSAGAPGQDRVYTIQYRPADGPGPIPPLVVRWTLDVISATFGNVTIQAATLTE